MQRGGGGNFMHNPLPFSGGGGQTLTDRLNSAKFTIAGSQIGKVVCKATTEEVIGPKKKHLDYLLHCTHEPNVNIPYLANLLIERTHSEHWAVVFKSLISMHNLMCYGNERFMQYLASCSARMDVVDFVDRTTATGMDMSTHVRQYGKYITEKINAYRKMAYDFCKVKRGREDGMFRTMGTDNLLKTIPVLQNQIAALLDFKVRSDDLTNGVINSAFILMFRDMIRLFACYNDGIINLLEKYFDMNKKQCREALTLYKAFVSRMDGVSEFLKVAESVGIDKGDIPDLSRAPSSLMEALEGHLAALEGGRPPPAQPAGFGETAARAYTQQQRQAVAAEAAWGAVGDGGALDDEAKRRYLEEEARYLDMLKARSKAASETAANVAVNSPEAVDSAWTPAGSSTTSGPAAAGAQSSSAIDDLLGLSDDWGAGNAQPAPPTTLNDQSYNPFAAMMSAQPAGYQSNDFWTQPQQHQPTNMTGAYQNGGAGGGGAGFTADFGHAFTQPASGGAPALGATLQPQRQGATGTGAQSAMARPASTGPPAQAANGKLLTRDLDTSLASLVQNLDMKDKNQRAHLSPSSTHGRTGGGPMASSLGGPAPGPTTGAGQPYYGGWAGAQHMHQPNAMAQPYWQPHAGPPYAAQPMGAFPPPSWQTAPPAAGTAQQPFF